MTTQEIIRALRGLQVETGSLACMGCRHEDNCGIKGCAVIRAAMESLEWTQTAGDCISRQDAIDRFMPYVHMDEKVPAETIIEELHMFPAVGMQEDQRWIPCEEIDKLIHSVENLSQNLETAYRQRDIYKSCFERITAHGDCNNCADIKVCEFAPDCGEDTRFNCPLWRGKKEG